MNRYVVMVDAGYFLRQVIEVLSSRSSASRADLAISDASGMIDTLLAKARSTLSLDGKELLRVYWYDGVMASGLTPQQRAIIDVNDVQFRAGTINGKGQQKGVDSLIVTDLIELTAHHAICDAVLVTGDSDLAVGIEVAQKRGIRIAVIGVEDLSVGVTHNQSFEITSRADRVGALSRADLTAFFRFSPSAKNGSGSEPVTAAVKPVISATPDNKKLEAAVASFIAQAKVPLGGAVDTETKRIESTVDRALLHHVFTQLGQGALTAQEKILTRDFFRKQLRT